jgi:hypothetical protein
LWRLDGGPPACTVAYAPFDPSTPPPDSVALADTWTTYPGTYLVAPANVSLDATLAASLATFRGGRPLRFVWVADPSPYGAYWQASSIAVAPGAAVTSGLSAVALGNLALWVGDGCTVAPNGGGDAIVITPRAGDPGSVYLTSDYGGASIGTAGAAVTVPFSGLQAGCATTAVTLADGDLERLDVGMRIFATDPAQPSLPDRLTSYRYPVFAAAQPALPASVSLDPVRPLDPQRTCFGLVPSGQTEGPELASCYVTTNGKAVHLVPRAPAGAPATAAMFVLAVRALSNGPSPMDPFYLVPSGAFRIRVVDGAGNELTGKQSLMCGTSGIESVEIDQPGCELWFKPGGAALAVGKGLEPTATTAYASVFGPNGAAGRIYRAQADSAALFTPSVESFMAFQPLIGTTLPAAPGGGALPSGYPMLAYTGIDDTDLDPYQQLEYQAVASTRRAAIAALPQEAPSASLRATVLAPRTLGAVATTPSITPQGLMADVDANGTVVNLTLALSGAGAIELMGVTPDLVTALQSSQLFLVASDPTTLCAGQPSAGGTSTLTGSPPITGEVQIPGSPDGSQVWAIDAWPATTWADSETLLVMKFAGKKLVDLAADTTTWAGDAGARFNGASGGVQTAQRILRGLIDEARKSSAPEFAAFAALADDATWQGILFLNAPVPPAELPTEISGLAAGIDASAFRAHHVGLTVTPAVSTSGVITPSKSSLFGLIFYVSPHTAAGAPPPYAFNVLNLKVRFENSMVKTFASQIQLLVDELFGERATLVDVEHDMAPRDANVLLLDGVYQQHGSTGGYTFTTPGDNLFSMSSAVLDTVDVATAQFVTVVAPTPGSSATPAESRFVLSGSLRFKPGALDVFSFGPDSVATPAERLSAERLFYSNLWITLDYVPNDATKDVYTFDASKMLPDPAQSVARSTSFFAGFPVTPTSFVHVRKQPEAKAGADAPPPPATPASLGFLGIGTTPPLGGAIKAPWFGIVADLGFGTAGALAAEVGFKASMLISWSPGTPLSANAGVGLKLPGTGSGGKLLSLQGVLKLKIGELSLSDHDGTYVLELDRIALSVLMLTFPPKGQVNALLFADPTGKDHTTLGWYAGYAGDS